MIYAVDYILLFYSSETLANKVNSRRTSVVHELVRFQSLETILNFRKDELNSVPVWIVCCIENGHYVLLLHLRSHSFGFMNCQIV